MKKAKALSICRDCTRLISPPETSLSSQALERLAEGWWILLALLSLLKL